MYKIPLSDLKEKIISSGKIDAADLDTKMKAKINELSGLISEEGAAHIIANELGVEVVAQNSDKLKIKEIYSGMRNVSAVGKVVRKFEVREFQKGDSTGKVCSLILGDETGTIRVVFWNDQVDQLKDVNEDDILELSNAYVRENNNNKEIHLGDRGEIIINPEGVEISSVRQSSSFSRKKIEELTDGQDGAEIMGTIVQVFDPRFFNVCPQCNRRANPSGEGFSCETHGEVQPVLSYVLNAVLDDGTGNIRGVFWKNQTKHLLNKSEEEMALFKENPTTFEEIKTDLLGEQFKVMGKVKKNDMFDRLEFNAQVVEKAKPETEIERLQK
jgi:ssDNA-binding replication factor A large subunit